MNLRRAGLLAAVLTAGSLAVAGPVTVSGASPAPGTHPSAAHPTAAGARPSPLVARGTHPQRVTGSGSAAPATPAAPAKVDPAVVGKPAARNGTVPVTVTGDAGRVGAQVRAHGGRVLSHASDRTVAVIPKSTLAALAGTSAVSHIGLVDRPVEAVGPSTGPSQGVAASGADAWHTAGITGAGVKIAIIDGGFGTSQQQYDTEVSAGHLGTDPQLINQDCIDTQHNNASTAFIDDHGLAVAELASQEAPGAQIYMYCVFSAQGVVNAEAAAHAAGVKVISSSLGWYGDARGDGTASPGTVAYAARTARQQGILWVNSAGNEVPEHFSGGLADANGDHYLDIGNHDANAYPFESNFYTVAPAVNGVPSDFAFVFRWDNWPTTTNTVTLDVSGAQCTTGFGGGGLDNCRAAFFGSASAHSVAGAPPVVTLDLADHGLENHSAFDQVWQVGVHLNTAFTKGARWDLYGNGDDDGASALSCPTGDSAGNCIFSAGALNGSLLSPANSPYVLAAGAADVGGDGTTPGTLEFFGSRGPTIDGRPKPDLTGWDGVNSYVYPDGFYGTSASAPNIAGAAALVASGNPSLDAAQIQNFLEQRANNGKPTNPAADSTGHGLLTLGSPADIAAPTPAAYQPLATPARVLDTRTTLGGHHSKIANGGVVTVSFPGLPADATAVAVNITGVGATDTSYLTAYPAGTAAPSTSNINLSRTDSTAAGLAVVTVNAHRTITIRNTGAALNVLVDELGWFGTGSSETGLYTPLPAPSRVLDTRTSTGGHHGQIPANGTALVDTGVPSGAIAAIVNVTAVSMQAPGFLGTGPTCSLRTSTLNFQRATRANLAIVGLDDTSHFCIANGPTATNVVADVEGYLMPGTGSGYVALAAPQRIVDTRTGNGGAAGGHASRALAPNSTTAFYGSNVGDVPDSATALLTGVVEASTTTGGSYLSMFPGTTTPPVLTSTVNFSPGRVVANASVTGLSNNRFAVYNFGGSTHVAVDLFGYFAPALG